jgi:hypothetical protein
MLGPRRVGGRFAPVALVALVCAASLLVAVDARSPRPAAAAPGSTCVGSTSPEALTSLFDLEPGGLVAADYQRAISLPDGRTLWMFQDASIRLPPPDPATTLPDTPPAPPATQLVHNAALLQTGTCFELLTSGTAAAPRPWLFGDDTMPFQHWFWPLDGTIGADGRLYIFVAEMVENGPLYLSITEPVATRVVVLDLPSLSVRSAGQPPNASASLYGFSITSDATWTYMYAQCHRQFGWSPSPLLPAHDLDCASNVTVARVPKGRVLDRPSYWDGTSWQADPARAAPVMPTAGRPVNPSQIRWNGSEFVAATKVGDWFGSTIFLDRAPSAQGPWITYARIAAVPKCAPTVCDTYFASWVPTALSGGKYVIGLSHNRWDGALSTVNRPTFFAVPAPGRFSLAARCTRVDC